MNIKQLVLLMGLAIANSSIVSICSINQKDIDALCKELRPLATQHQVCFYSLDDTDQKKEHTYFRKIYNQNLEEKMYAYILLNALENISHNIMKTDALSEEQALAFIQRHFEREPREIENNPSIREAVKQDLCAFVTTKQLPDIFFQIIAKKTLESFNNNPFV